MNPVETLKAVLCGQDGKCCIAGSEADRKVVDEALAALDTAQPVPDVNAMLVEALEAAEKLEHEALVALSEATYELKVGNTYTTATDTYKANNDLIHRLDKILNSQYRDRKRAALTAAKQAQPDGINDVYLKGYEAGKQAQLARPINCGTGHCSCIECPYEQAQPEPSVPEGWKLVPIDPTEAMLEVGFFAEKDVFDSAKTKRIHVWKAMIAAAPQPKETK